MPKPGRLTERSYYRHLLNSLEKYGSYGASEVNYNSQPDILFYVDDCPWLMPVKIGTKAATLKNAFIQYLRHVADSGCSHAALLFLPDSAASAAPSSLADVLKRPGATLIVHTPYYNDQKSGPSAEELIDWLYTDVIPKVRGNESKSFSLEFVIDTLKQHVSEMMGRAVLDEDDLAKVVTNPSLLRRLAGLSGAAEREAVARFFSAYILLSQTMFFRMFAVGNPSILLPRPVSREALRYAFSKVLEIDYKAIFELDVMDILPEDVICETYDLISGLHIEDVRHELPGRCFHALMPDHLRKKIAAFYTRPYAADLLANLALDSWDMTVMDPACGSGTILVSAYKRKLDLLHSSGYCGNPHSRFCVNDLFGMDIMAFAAHLATANLASMDPQVRVNRFQISIGDSLELKTGVPLSTGFSKIGLPIPPMVPASGTTCEGEMVPLIVPKLDAVLMNPPFTKAERKVDETLGMAVSPFQEVCGKEVGLWGPFILLADMLLKDGGILGAILPINFLRGTESERIRKFILTNYRVLALLKPTLNYGFSEQAEYRDIILVAQKEKPSTDHRVKIVLVKKDLKQLADGEPKNIARSVRTAEGPVRSPELDIDFVPQRDLFRRMMNLMWFCGSAALSDRDTIAAFVSTATADLRPPRSGLFKTGFRPAPSGVSKILFATRKVNPARVEEAFLRFDVECAGDELRVQDHIGNIYSLEKPYLRPTLRTPVGLTSMSISSGHDYIAVQEYSDLSKVKKAVGVGLDTGRAFWATISARVENSRTLCAVTRRMNPFSPNCHHVAFGCNSPFYPSDQFNVLNTEDTRFAKAVTVMLNSLVFIAQLFLLKEESTGRFIDVRIYDLEEASILPSDEKAIDRLASVYDEYSSTEFPPLREQFDQTFDIDYKAFCDRGRRRSQSYGTLGNPSRLRLGFDSLVFDALKLDITESQVRYVYEAIARDMMVIQSLARD